MPFVSPLKDDFIGPVFQNFENSLASRSWPLTIDLGTASELPVWKQELAFAVVSQACHAEYVGMCTAAMLVLEAPTAQLRYAFAAAAQDEAMHSSVLGRYAVARGGYLADVNSHHAGMKGPLLDSDVTYEERAALHTLLEGFALDQFKSFVVAFQGDLLGDIYVRIRQDEARHVALGFLALKDAPPFVNALHVG